MAAWFSVVRAILPHVSTIVSAAVPAFTRYKAGHVNDADLLQQQISELQNASAQNTALIKDLAEQLRDTLAALQQATVASEKKAQELMRLVWAAIGVAVIAAVLAVYVVLTY